MRSIDPGGLMEKAREEAEFLTARVHTNASVGFGGGQDVFFKYLRHYKFFSAGLLFIAGVWGLFNARLQFSAYCFITLHLQMIININTRR